MYGMIRTIAALIPPLYLIWYIYRLDAVEKEPPKLLRKLFLLGCLSVVPAVILEVIAENVLQGISPTYEVYIVLENFIGIALVEEGCKYFFLYNGTWKSPEFNYRFDGIVYAAVTSLGFAALENVGYVLTMSEGFGLAIMRALTSIPGHFIFGIWMGYYYAKARAQAHAGQNAEVKANLRKAVLVPMLLHGTYDLLCTVQASWSTGLFIAFDIAMVVVSLRKVKEFASQDQHIQGGASPFGPGVRSLSPDGLDITKLGGSPDENSPSNKTNLDQFL